MVRLPIIFNPPMLSPPLLRLLPQHNIFEGIIFFSRKWYKRIISFTMCIEPNVKSTLLDLPRFILLWVILPRVILPRSILPRGPARELFSAAVRRFCGDQGSHLAFTLFGITGIN